MTHRSTATSLRASIKPAGAHWRRDGNIFSPPPPSRLPVFTTTPSTVTYISAGPRCSRGKETRESRTLIAQEGASAARARGRAGRPRPSSAGSPTGSTPPPPPPVAAGLNNSSRLIYLSGSVTHKHTRARTHTHKELQLSPLSPSSPAHTHTHAGTHASGVGGVLALRAWNLQRGKPERQDSLCQTHEVTLTD